jgi:alginate O-acetyltransferase complex protein AlgI
MLFNSYSFLLLFLPVTLLVFFRVGRYSQRLGATWLTAASLFFYGWWNPAYLSLLLASILFNYAVGFALAREYNRGHEYARNRLLAWGILGNLALLAWFKYAGFIAGNVNAAFGAHLDFGGIILPLGISFFTFTQIAFLVDASKGLAREFNFIHYCLFVTYFPHLIAGPVLHHKEMMPQFARPETYRLNHENLAVGFSIFAIGLFKKVVLADSIAAYATPVFAAAHQDHALTFFEAWGGALSYTLQLYFDFSGYSDMAIGLSRLFGIKLPLNFASPYQAVNIIDFWRRWHMTLSRFLRDYLYIPLGGSRHGAVRRYINLFVTMLLGGLWHGAGWTYVVWGGLHGLYLTINHAWHGLSRAYGRDPERPSRAGRLVGRAITFLAVVVGWVFFRSESVDGALRLLKTMSGFDGIVLRGGLETLLPTGSIAVLGRVGIRFGYMGDLFSMDLIILLAGLLALVWMAPNTQEIISRFTPALDCAGRTTPNSWLSWRPSRAWAVVLGGATGWAILNLNRVSEFLYFQF